MLLRLVTRLFRPAPPPRLPYSVWYYDGWRHDPARGEVPDGEGAFVCRAATPEEGLDICEVREHYVRDRYGPGVLMVVENSTGRCVARWGDQLAAA